MSTVFGGGQQYFVLLLVFIALAALVVLAFWFMRRYLGGRRESAKPRGAAFLRRGVANGPLSRCRGCWRRLASLSRAQASAPHETQRRTEKIREPLTSVRKSRLPYLAPYVSFRQLRTIRHKASRQLCAMYGRRPRCKGKESDLSRNDTGAAMYPASRCSRSGRGP